MISKIQKWGNSQGVRFPKELLRQASFSLGEEVELRARHGEIRLRPVLQIRGKYRLKDLVARMPSRYAPEAADWGAPLGKEAW